MLNENACVWASDYFKWYLQIPEVVMLCRCPVILYCLSPFSSFHVSVYKVSFVPILSSVSCHRHLFPPTAIVPVFILPCPALVLVFVI